MYNTLKAIVDMSTEQMFDEVSRSKANCLHKPHKEAFNLSMSTD